MRGVQERRAVLPALRSGRYRLALAAAIAAATAGVDQLTKTLAVRHLAGGHLTCPATAAPRHVVGTLWWVLTCNGGAAFGLGHGATPVVEAVVVVVVAALLLAGRRAARAPGRLLLVGLGLLVGGAAGNLVDRLGRGNGGAVIDFIDAVQVGRHELWPVFNVADAAIVVGAVLAATGWARRG